MIAAITGANGFIGRNLTMRLAQLGWRVRALARRTHATAPPWLADFPADAAKRVEWLPVDYAADQPTNTLTRHLHGIDALIHLAGATRAPTVDALRAANVGVTERLLDAARAAVVPRFVLVSSQAAAGPAPDREHPRVESDTPIPVEAYGRSKRDAELLTRKSGLPFAIVRPAAVYGPADKDFLNLFRLARFGLALHPANRSHWISIIHVRDLVDGLLCAATDERALGETFFLANDEPMQWGALFTLAAAAAETTLRADLEVPAPLVQWGAELGDAYARLTGSVPLLTTQKLQMAREPFWICSSDKAKATLGWVQRVGLPEGFRDVYRWYVDHGWVG
jgi:nucleoside-diphosphate-sugar epimerase